MKKRIPEHHKILLDTNILICLAIRRERSERTRRFIRELRENTRIFTLDKNVKEFLGLMKGKYRKRENAGVNYENNKDQEMNLSRGLEIINESDETFKISVLPTTGMRRRGKYPIFRLMKEYNDDLVIRKKGIQNTDCVMLAYASLFGFRIITEDNHLHDEELIMAIDRINSKHGIVHGLNLVFYPGPGRDFWYMVYARGL